MEMTEINDGNTTPLNKTDTTEKEALGKNYLLLFTNN